jgi:glucose dehydrogenase
MRSARRVALAVLVGLIATGSVAPTRAVNGNATDDWPSYGRDFTNQRFSPLSQITTKNVSQLRLAWAHTTQPAPVAPVEGIFKQESSPVVVDGVLYYTYPGPQVFALDAATGEERWRWNVSDNGTIRVCCGPNNRGVAVATRSPWRRSSPTAKSSSAPRAVSSRSADSSTRTM